MLKRRSAEILRRWFACNKFVPEIFHFCPPSSLTGLLSRNCQNHFRLDKAKKTKILFKALGFVVSFEKIPDYSA